LDRTFQETALGVFGPLFQARRKGP
jgi:hypothetical protein